MNASVCCAVLFESVASAELALRLPEQEGEAEQVMMCRKQEAGRRVLGGCGFSLCLLFVFQY